MPRKVGMTTRSTLVNAALPAKTKTYTVISHSYAINTILAAIAANGFEVESEEYKCNTDAKVAHGVFKINYDGDPELSMVYSFSNSYDKTLRFKAAIGAQILDNGAYMISDVDHWKRKHTGTADNETQQLINEHISNAQSYFDTLQKDKESMKKLTISRSEFGRLLGELFIDELITLDQLSVIVKEYENPSFKYSTGKDNLWTCYNHVVYALRQSHPAKWMKSQVGVHLYFTSHFGIGIFDHDEKSTTETTKTVNIDGEDVPVIPGILQGVEELPILPGFESVVTSEFTEKANQIPDAVQKTLEEEILDAELDAEKDYSEVDNMVTNEESNFPKGSSNISDEEMEIVVDEAIENYPETMSNLEDISEVSAPEQHNDDEEISEEIHVVMESNIPEDTVTEILEELKDPEEIALHEIYYLKSILPSDTEIIPDNIVVIDGVECQILREETHDGIDYVICLPISDEIFNNVSSSILPEQKDSESLEVPESLEHPELEEPISFEEIVENAEFTPIPDPVVEENSKNTRVKNIIANELQEIYGYDPKFTFSVNNSQYNIVLESGESISLSVAYIESLL